MSYFQKKEDALTVSINMMNNPFDVKKCKDYFKKKEFFLTSNTGMQNVINPLDEQYDDEFDEDVQKRKKEIE